MAVRGRSWQLPTLREKSQIHLSLGTLVLWARMASRISHAYVLRLVGTASTTLERYASADVSQLLSVASRVKAGSSSSTATSTQWIRASRSGFCIGSKTHKLER